MLNLPYKDVDRPRGGNSGNKGFTLIEMIVALVLLSTLVAVFGMGLVAAMQSFDFSRANGEVVQKAQLAMARLIRELTELTAIRHVDGDGHFIVYDRVVQTSEGTARTITYGLQYKADKKEVILFSDIPPGTTEPPLEENGDVLSDDIGGLTLRFYRGEEDWTLSASDIALLSTIEIELVVIRPDRPDIPLDELRPFKTLIHLRNTGNQGGALKPVP